MAANYPSYTGLLQNPSRQLPESYGSVNGAVSISIDSSIMDGISVEGRLSRSRRLFMMLTLFDMLFVFLVWIICTVVSNNSSFQDAFRNEVVNYNISSSMFDIVVLGVGRFFIIVFFYLILRLSHWSIVSLTTAGTVVFITAKVFLYKWSHSGNTTASIVLLLCSFILSWGEAWFLDFRVLPKESKASAFLAQKMNVDERSPILAHPPLSRSQSDDGSAFYSPPISDGEDEGKESDRGVISEVEWLSPKNSRELVTTSQVT